MTIAMRNPNASHIDFGFLSGVISSNQKAMPSDLDMIFERKSQFFIGEWKMLGEPISYGQEITLKALSKLDNFNVYIIQGYSNNQGRMVGKIYKFVGGNLMDIGDGEERLKDIMRAWYADADSR
tara:strand:+ start:726 stop:1097 length:372 start_codon:yes stop_codon:yes gene_type:complete